MPSVRGARIAWLPVILLSVNGCATPHEAAPRRVVGPAASPAPTGKTETPARYPPVNPTSTTTLIGESLPVRPSVATTRRFQTDEPGTLHLTTRWYDRLVKGIVMTLTSPSGRVIDRDTHDPDVSHERGPTSDTYHVTSPEQGTWTVTLRASQVAPEGAEVWLNADQDKTPSIAPRVSVEQLFDGRTVTLAVAATPSPARRIVEYLWEFGDGDITRGSDARTVQHTYTEPGEYLVSVAAMDDKGHWGVGHASTSVVVE